MNLFNPDNANRTARTARVHAAYEIAHTIADFLAAALFIIGSVMFFFEAWVTAGTWAFLFGSIFFAMKPTLKLAREIHYVRMGDYGALADRARD